MTTSYTAGTVSVSAGSVTVTGTGTGWLTANVAPGFLGLDSANGNPVPVAEIVSDTQLTLVKPWRGTSASGQAYWLSYDTRDGQQTVNNAQRLAEYIALLRSAFFSAFNGLTPAANTFPYFGAGATAALGAITSVARSFLAGGVLDNTQTPDRIKANAVEVTAAGSLDAIAESGWVRCSGANVVAAGGPANAVAGICETRIYSTSNAEQEYTNVTGNNRTWKRYKAGSTWQPWLQVVLGDIDGNALDGSLPARLRSQPTGLTASGALDAVSETGWTRVQASNVATVGGPSGASSGACFTLIYDANNAVQTYRNVATTYGEWTRYKTAGNWQPWTQNLVGSVLQKLAQLGPVLGGSNIPFPSAAGVGLSDGDFDSLIISGVYNISGTWANGFLGAAATAGYGGTLDVRSRSSTVVYQEYRTNNSGTVLVYSRNLAGTTWTDWRLVSTNIVGTVSQFGGQVRGSVIERGSNSNGEYVRFADGTQICTTQINIPSATQAFGAGFITASADRRSWVFPAPFASSAPPASVSGNINAVTGATVVAYSISSSSCGVMLSSLSSVASTAAMTGLTAIGRWF